MIKPRLSIIIPVYNGTLFIKQALGSLCPQLTQGVEIIVVNDGSTDNTVNLIHAQFQVYIETQQLSVLSQANQGVSVARNLGVAHALGDYIGFMDADDLALPNYISTLLSAMSHNTDIVEFGYKTFVKSINEIKNKPTLYTNNQFGSHAIAQVIDKVYSTSRWYPWSRIFQKQLLHDVRFPTGVKFCEDVMTIPNLYEKAQSIFVMREAIYAYRINPNGATYQVGQDYVENIVRYYQTIPFSGLIRHDLLRISFAFTIISCQIKTSGDWVLPTHIQNDMYELRKVLPIYWKVSPRVIAMLFFPSTFKYLRKWLKK